MSQQEHDAPAQVMKLLFGSLVTQMIGAAVELKIPTLLGDTAKSSDELASICGAHPDATYRLLRGLSTVGLFSEHDHRFFSLTPLGQCLREEVPGSLSALARLTTQSWHFSALGETTHAIRTGESAFKKVHGQGMFEWLAARPTEARAFGQAMTSFSAIEAHLLVLAYDFSRYRKVVDVAGGHGYLLSEVLLTSPDSCGVLEECSSVLEGARQSLRDRGLSDRCEFVVGDIFESVPPEGDAYLLKHVIHDWDDAHATKILKNIAASISREGHLLLIEQVMSPPGIPHFSKILDLALLTITEGGRERTLIEHNALLANAGFRLERVVPTLAQVSILQASLERPDDRTR